MAVYAVDRYLRDFLIETDIEASDSWSPGFLSPPDVADLVVANVGKLECRPVIEDATEFRLPESAWDDRVAYVAVRFRESLHQAELLGYLPVPKGEPPTTIALNQLLPIADLLGYLQCLEDGHTWLESDDPVAVRVQELLKDRDRAEFVMMLERIYRKPPAIRLYAVENLLKGEQPASEVQVLMTKSLMTETRSAFPSLAASSEAEITEAQAEAALEALAEQVLAKLKEIWGDR